jgi:hypothetical protein
MNYTLRIYKRHGEPLYAIRIDKPEAEPNPGMVWEVVQTFEMVMEEPIPAALCGLPLMSESTSDHLFRQIADTWLGPVEDDPLNDYDRYATREDSKEVLDEAYLDRLEDDK